MKQRTQNLFEQIESYLSGNLTEQEKSDFEARMNADVRLKTEVENHRSLHGALNDSDTLEFRKKLNRIGTEIHGEEITSKQNSRYRKRSWQIAASVAIIAGLSIFWWLKSTDSPENLYATYYEPYPVEDLLRGANEEGINDMVKEYSDGLYMKSIPNLMSLVQKYPNRTELKLYLGSSYLNTDQANAALDIFMKIERENKYYEEAQWYLALSYLKIEDIDNATIALGNVISYNGIHKTHAKALLNKLKS